LRAGDSVRAVAKIVLTSKGRSVSRWVAIARPRPREQPVIR
jgi:antitoxin (DNA-binding transcriptional repressor) of toxin-antitoxin stability system